MEGAFSSKAGATSMSGALAPRRANRLEDYFYLFMAVLITAVVVYGFSQTVENKLFPPPQPRPLFTLRCSSGGFFSSAFNPGGCGCGKCPGIGVSAGSALAWRS